MFKLYRRDGETLRYWEAWVGSHEVTEHKGMCGEQGNSRNYPPGVDPEARLASIRDSASEAGFTEIPLDDHAGVIVECEVDGFGTEDDLALRYELHDWLDEVLGWTGLGHCDGGSIGSGSMEAYCFVVDGPLAVAVIRKALRGTKFHRFEPRVDPYRPGTQPLTDPDTSYI